MVAYNVIIGSKIRELRKEKNMTQAELAIRLNVSQQTLSRYESGATQISYAELVRLVEYFKMPVEYFFGMEFQEVSEDEIRLVAYYRTLNRNILCTTCIIIR